MKRFIATLALVAMMCVGIAACSDDKAAKPNSDQAVSAEIEARYLRNQPIPQWTRSQLRASLIGIETAQVNAVSTTAFFFNMGVVDPTDTCAALGLPIPATSQLSNPSKIYTKNRQNHSDIVEVLPNMEPNGIYTGDTSGTYVLCTGADGSTYANYHEGPVKVVTGPAKWDYDKHKVVILGPSSVDFNKLLEGK